MRLGSFVLTRILHVLWPCFSGVRKLVFAAGWYLAGFVTFGAVVIASAMADLKHTASPSAIYEIGWMYVTLAVAVLSVLYPLALGLRDSLTARLFAAFDQLCHAHGGNVDRSNPAYEQFERYAYIPVRRFRKHLFDRQLPFVVSFTGASIIRVSLELINIGPFSPDRQIVEPQIYVIVYVLWAGWVAITILIVRPFYAVEWAEALYRGLPPLELPPADRIGA